MVEMMIVKEDAAGDTDDNDGVSFVSVESERSSCSCWRRSMVSN